MNRIEWFVVGTIEDFKHVWEDRPNVLIWSAAIALICLAI